MSIEKRLHRSGFHVSCDNLNRGLRLENGLDKADRCTLPIAKGDSLPFSPVLDGVITASASTEAPEVGAQWPQIAAEPKMDLNSIRFQCEAEMALDTMKQERALLGSIIATGGTAAAAGTTMLGLVIAHINQAETTYGSGPDFLEYILSAGVSGLVFGIVTFVLIKILRNKKIAKTKHWRIGMIMAIIGLGSVALSALTLVFYTLFALFRSLFNRSD